MIELLQAALCLWTRAMLRGNIDCDAERPRMCGTTKYGHECYQAV